MKKLVAAVAALFCVAMLAGCGDKPKVDPVKGGKGTDTKGTTAAKADVKAS